MSAGHGGRHGHGGHRDMMVEGELCRTSVDPVAQIGATSHVLYMHEGEGGTGGCKRARL